MLLTIFALSQISLAQSNKSIAIPLGTKTTYEPGQTTYTKPPDGYQPVFINYVGRHGARFLTKPEGDVQLLELLKIAGNSNALTQKGQVLQKMVEDFIKIEKNNYGNITLRGAEEQKSIGIRMFQNNKNAFHGRLVEITMTEEIRTEQSAKAFMTGLGTRIPEQIIMQKMSDSLNDRLRFYDIAPGYLSYKKNHEVISKLDSLKKDPRSAGIPVKIAHEIFNPDFASELLDAKIKIKGKQNQDITFQPEWLIDDLYSLYGIQFSIDLEIIENKMSKSDIDFGSFFDETTLKWLGFKSCAADFMLKGPGTDSMGVQVTNAAPLLIDFISTTDSVVNKSVQLDACLRFAHAETISPFVALMGIASASKSSSSIYDFDKVWKASEIIPLSANVQWILYSNGNDYLVKVLMNEREVALPIESSGFPYYRWDDVKTYYIKKLKDLQISLADDTHKYLLQLR